jgi:hypothetical protein
VKPVKHGIDRVRVTFDDDQLVADAGLALVATLVGRLGLEPGVRQLGSARRTVACERLVPRQATFARMTI